MTAPALNIVKLAESERRVLLRANISDGGDAELSNQVLASVADYTIGTDPVALSINKIWWSLENFSVELKFEADTPIRAITLSGNGSYDFESVYGIKNPGGSGSTGNILLDTYGISINSASGCVGSFIIELWKVLANESGGDLDTEATSSLFTAEVAEVSGGIIVGGNSTASGYIKFLEDTDNGINYVTVTAPSSLAANYTVTLPSNTGTILTSADIGVTVEAYDPDLDYLATNVHAQTATVGAYIDFLEATNNGTNKIKLETPAALAADYTLTLPAETGTILTNTDIGVTVQAYDADLTYLASNMHAQAATEAAYVDFLEATDNGTSKVTLTAADSLAADYVVTLPSVTGTLLTDQAIGSTVEAYDAGLASIAGLTTAADNMIYTTASDTYATTSLTSAGRAILDDATASDQRTTLGVAIGTDVQAYDAGLASIAGLTTAADKMIYTTASDTYTTTDLTSAGRAILDDANAEAQRTTLGLVIGTNVQAYNANLADLATNYTAASASGAASLKFLEDADNGTSGITLQAPAALSGDVLLTLPDNDGNSGQILKTDGNGVLSWVDNTAGGALTPATALQGASLKLYEVTENGTDYVEIKAPDALTGNVVLTLPATDGDDGQVLKTNGSGVMDWVAQPTAASLNLEIGSDVQAYSANLADLATNYTAASSSGAASLAFFEDTDNGTNKVTLKAPAAVTADVNFVLPDGDGDSGQVLSTDGSGNTSWIAQPTAASLDLEIGTDVQAYDAGLASIAGLTTAADKMIYTTASDTYATADLTTAGRAILDDANAEAQRTTLGLAIGTDVQAYSANLADLATNYVKASSSGAATLSLYEDTDEGTNKVTLTVPALAGDYILTLPTTDGDANQLLKTDGSGNLSWTNPPSGLTEYTSASASGPGSIYFAEDADNGTSKITIQAPAALSADVTLTLPDNDGDSGQFLQTNGSGVLTWATSTGTGIGNVVEDTTPQLGGNLDVNSNSIVSASNGNITLAPNGSGNVVITDANIVMSSTQGIDFSAGSNAAGMTAELLDDYEEGTWSPTLVAFTSDPTVSYNTGYGAMYTKVGRMVYLSGVLATNSYSDGSGAAAIGGLPFTIADHSGSDHVTYTGMASTESGYTKAIHILRNSVIDSDRIYMRFKNDNGAEDHLTLSDVSGAGNTYLYFSFYYMTDD